MVWSNPVAFQQDVSRHRQVVADQYREIVSALVSLKRLSEDERKALTPLIATTVNDRRKNKSEPLPALKIA